MKDRDDIYGTDSSVPPRVYRTWLAMGLLAAVLATVVWMAAGTPSLRPPAATPASIVTTDSLSVAPAENATDTVSLETSTTGEATSTASVEDAEVSFDGTAMASADAIVSDDAAPPDGAAPLAPPVVPVTPPPPSPEPTETVTPPSPDPPDDWLPGFGRGKGHGWGHFK